MNLPAEPAAQQSDADPTADRSGADLDRDSVPDPSQPAAHPPVDRRLLDEVFGEVLPETTSDERAERDDRGGRSATSDDWYYENRPPHHDR